MIRDLSRDIRFALRTLVRNPTLSAVAVVSLALGVGANTTMFTVVHAVLIAPIPVRDQSSLALVFMTDTSQEATNPFGDFLQLSYPNYEDLRDQNDVFEGLAASTFGGGTLLPKEGDPQPVQGFLVSGNYFEVLGVKAEVGRTFLSEEDENPGTHRVMVLSYGLWERHFGGDREVIGREYRLNGSPFTVVGVAPKNFTGTFQAVSRDLIWTPMMTYRDILPPQFQDWPESRRASIMNVVGRLKTGVTVDQADAALKTIARRLEEEYPAVNSARNVQVTEFTPLFSPTQRDQFNLIGQILMGVVGVVLLIACANVANLLLARAATREKEIAIRMSMGAGRKRLIGQLLTEAIVLSVCGGALGLLLAYWGRGLLWSFRPPNLPEDSISLAFNIPVLGFTFAVAILTGILFGLVPALHSSKPNLTLALHEGGRGGGSSRRQNHLRNALVVCEVALAVVALVAAGLFIRSMQAAQQIETGFEMERLASMFLNPTGIGYDQARTESFYDELVEKAAAVHGVKNATIASMAPFGGGLMRTLIPEGRSEQEGILTLNNIVAPGYFETLRIPLLRGRDFTDFDTKSTSLVAIINEATQRRFWPDEDPIGKRFHFIQEEEVIEIVGTVKDSLVQIGQPAQPIAYLPYQQRFAGAMNLIVQSSESPESVLSEVQSVVRSIDANLAVTGVATVGQTLDQALWAPRMGAALIGAFGVIALILALVGVSGVMAYSVSQRVHEIGIRMALGSSRSSIMRMMLRQGMTLVGIGVFMGVIIAFGLSQLLESLLFGISAIDPITFLAAPTALILISMLASYLPVRRILQFDPVSALRQQ